MVNFDYWFSQLWVQLLCFIFFTCITAHGLKTRSALLAHRIYKRSEDPGLYWAAVGSSAVAAVCTFLLLVHGLTNWPDL